jgi:hypothetical protein
MKVTWKPLNLIPLIALILMLVVGLIDWWVFIAIGISHVDFYK